MDLRGSLFGFCNTGILCSKRIVGIACIRCDVRLHQFPCVQKRSEQDLEQKPKKKKKDKSKKAWLVIGSLRFLIFMVVVCGRLISHGWWSFCWPLLLQGKKEEDGCHVS